MEKPETIMIDDVKYIRAAQQIEPAKEVNGLKYAIVRSRNHGVIAGYIESYAGQIVIVLNSRRIYYYVGCQTLEELAKYGSTQINGCKICPTVAKTIMLEACGIIYASEKSRQQIEEAKEWKC